jgi:sterol desaturase/sphingolipid hydroxylase (fatty acid hydroxylase superfamily)
MIHQIALYILNRPALFVGLLFVTRIIVLTTVERLNPARPVRYREVMLRDLAAAAAFGLLIGPGAEFVNRWFALRPAVPQALMALPLLWRFLLYLVLADFGYYWVHRLMHTSFLWRIHKWHHSPTYMYWLAGIRGSFTQQVLVNLPYIFAGVLLDVGPWWIGVAIIMKNSVQNDWMHLNVPWGANWIEWLIVTPRYHHIHHSDDPRHYRANVAALFPIWDRLFGTYVAPETAGSQLSFGIGERVPAIRLLLGV